MQKKILALVFVFLSVSSLSAQQISPAPDFKLQDLRGNTVSLASYKDKKPVILLFWATWCYYCRKQLKELNKDYSTIVNDGVELLTINTGESSDKIKRYLEESRFNYRVLLDSNDEVSRTFSVVGVPTYVFINKKGNIIFNDHYFSREKYEELISK